MRSSTGGAERVAPYLQLILAPNPGPMTLDGTNTWIVGDPDRESLVVIDPGPLDEGHLQRVMDACGGRIASVLLTHWHHDHSEAAAALAARAGCGVRAAHPDYRVGTAGLDDGDVVELAGATLTAYATPGHTADSVSLLLVADEDGEARLLTGDMVLGRGTTVIMHPDGDLAAYFASIALMETLVGVFAVREILPGHGPRVADPSVWLAFYRNHRLERLDQVRAALAAGATTPAEVVAEVYADVDRSVWPAAELSARAQLAFLARDLSL
jgi:glyoxylase-like metal-dependent hydrolase (beta-lactamase superfamily II)